MEPIEKKISFETRQANAEKRIKELQPLVELANLRLEHAYQHEPDTFMDVVEEVTHELDDAWPYINEEFLVVGKWYTAFPLATAEAESGQQDDESEESFEASAVLTVNEPEDEDNKRVYSVNFTVGRQPVMDRALSQGFGVSDEKGVPQITYLFVRREYLSAPVSSYILMSANLYGAAFPEDVSLEYIGPASESQKESSWQAIHDEIDLGESLHGLYVTRPNFYEIPAKRQQKLMTGLVERANRLINLFGPIEVEVKAAMMFVSSRDGVNLDSVTHNSPFLNLKGKLAGVDLLNRSVLDGGVTSPDQLVSLDAGLYLDIVDLKAPTPQAIIDHRVAHVVFRSIKTLAMSSA